MDRASPELATCSDGDALSIRRDGTDITDATVIHHDEADCSMTVRVGNPGFTVTLRYSESPEKTQLMGPTHPDIAEEYGFTPTGVLDAVNMVEFQETVEAVVVTHD